jgi:hypothetical protein
MVVISNTHEQQASDCDWWQQLRMMLVPGSQHPTPTGRAKDRQAYTLANKVEQNIYDALVPPK